MTIYDHLMAMKPVQPEPGFTTKDYLDARDHVIRSEIQGVGDRVEIAVGELRKDIDGRLNTIDADLKRRPETDTVSKTVRTSLAWFGTILAAVVAIIWAAFDTGSAVTASFSDDIIASKDAYQNVSFQVNAMDAKYEQIDTKLDQLIAASNSADPQGTIQPK